MLYPITFSIPKEKIIVDDIDKIHKTKILSDLIPGVLSTYIYNTEEEYYNEYKKSYFAITQKKSGWDCMRHYEILANGCIPYFLDVEKCPIYTMFFLPKQLLIESKILFDTCFKNKTIDELTPEIIEKYRHLRKQLLEHTLKYLTTDKMAYYILKITNHIHVSNILYLSGNLYPDYLRCVTLHGFKVLLGKNCHDYPKVPHLYKSNIDITRLYGKGITYSKLLENDLHEDRLNNTLIEDIKNKKYDIIIYGSYHRGMPYYNLISKIYEPNKIILLCGEDIHNCNYHYFVNKGHPVFVREIS